MYSTSLLEGSVGIWAITSLGKPRLTSIKIWVTVGLATSDLSPNFQGCYWQEVNLK